MSKGIKTFYRIVDFEEFVNSPGINILNVDIKAMEQSAMFQESFFAIVYYEVMMIQQITNQNHEHPDSICQSGDDELTGRIFPINEG